MHDEKRAAQPPQTSLNGADPARTAQVPSARTEQAQREEVGDTAAVHGTGGHVQSAEIVGKALARARVSVAWMLEDALDRRGFSRRALASFAKIDESIVRKWLPQEKRPPRKPIPLAALAVIPIDLAKEIVDRIFADRLGGVGDSASALVGAGKRVEEDLRTCDPARRERLLKAMRGVAAALLRATEETQ